MKNIFYILIALTIISCKNPTEESGKLKVVTTTSMLTDLIKNIGGDLIEVNGDSDEVNVTEDVPLLSLIKRNSDVSNTAFL